jgi:hypothetical protein
MINDVMKENENFDDIIKKIIKQLKNTGYKGDQPLN